MTRQIVFTAKAAKPPPTYSQAVKAAGLAFVSGTAPTDAATGAQAHGRRTRWVLTANAALQDSSFPTSSRRTSCANIWPICFTSPRAGRTATSSRSSEEIAELVIQWLEPHWPVLSLHQGFNAELGKSTT